MEYEISSQLRVEVGVVDLANNMDYLCTAFNAYRAKLNDALESIELKTLWTLIVDIHDLSKTNGTLYVCGNGGSATSSTHIATDLAIGLQRCNLAINVVSLNDNAGQLTAIANDYDFAEIFSRQLKVCGKPGDILLMISASGNSENLIQACAEARNKKMKTAAFLGFDGGALVDMVDLPVWIESAKGEYGVCEDAHLILNHFIFECIRDQFGKA